MMLDEPHATAATHGYATAGWVAAPAAGRVIARIGPMLGMLPDIADDAAIQQALYIPLQPGAAGRRCPNAGRPCRARNGTRRPTALPAARQPPARRSARPSRRLARPARTTTGTSRRPPDATPCSGAPPCGSLT